MNLPDRLKKLRECAEKEKDAGGAEGYYSQQTLKLLDLIERQREALEIIYDELMHDEADRENADVTKRRIRSCLALDPFEEG